MAFIWPVVSKLGRNVHVTCWGLVVGRQLLVYSGTKAGRQSRQGPTSQNTTTAKIISTRINIIVTNGECCAISISPNKKALLSASASRLLAACPWTRPATPRERWNETSTDKNFCQNFEANVLVVFYQRGFGIARKKAVAVYGAK